MVRFATADLLFFLAATYRLVPPGAEQIDDRLERFLVDVLTRK